MADYPTLVTQAAAEIARATAAVAVAELDALIAALTQANRVVLHGVGREGLMMRALAMRLYHAGLDVHMVGDMSCPPVGPGDLLVVSAGPGEFATILGLVQIAKAAGAQTACVTAMPAAGVPAACDLILTIPAQTMATDQTGGTSVLPMGSVFEGAQFLTFEMLILRLADHIGASPAALRARHTNLE
jgi:6-phospho-3-hexuloisomerase